MRFIHRELPVMPGEQLELDETRQIHVGQHLELRDGRWNVVIHVMERMDSMLGAPNGGKVLPS